MPWCQGLQQTVWQGNRRQERKSVCSIRPSSKVNMGIAPPRAHLGLHMPRPHIAEGDPEGSFFSNDDHPKRPPAGHHNRLPTNNKVHDGLQNIANQQSRSSADQASQLKDHRQLDHSAQAGGQEEGSGESSGPAEGLEMGAKSKRLPPLENLCQPPDALRYILLRRHGKRDANIGAGDVRVGAVTMADPPCRQIVLHIHRSKLLCGL